MRERSVWRSAVLNSVMASTCAFDADDGDVFADPVRLGEYDGEARHDVAQHALGREGDAGAGDAETGHQRQQFDAEILQRHDDEQPEHENARDAGQQLPHRRFEIQPV